MHSRIRAIAMAASLGLFPATALAFSCPANFLDGKPPAVQGRVAEGAVELCNGGYATLFSPLSLEPVYSAEHLTAERLRAAKERDRKDAFHADERLPGSMRTTLTEWKTTGFCVDRGHLANDRDMAGESDEFESFALSNMVVQDTDNNEHLWEGIESAVRGETERYGEVYVVTGPIFSGPSVKRINGRMLMPTHLFKAFYIPSTGQEGIYLTANGAGDDYWSVSSDDLKALTGVDPFPGLSAAVKSSHMAALPQPKPHIPHARNREMRGACRVLAATTGYPGTDRIATGSPVRTAPGGEARGSDARGPSSRPWWAGIVRTLLGLLKHLLWWRS